MPIRKESRLSKPCSAGQWPGCWPRSRRSKLKPPPPAWHSQAAPARRAIRQGEVYWLAIAPQGAEPGPAHPCVVVQDDAINRSRVNSVVVCALTTNRKKASLPGNLLLEAGEANLPKASVVEVSKLSAVDRAQFGERLGSLSEARIQQILAGMKFLQTSASGTDELAGSERQH